MMSRPPSPDLTEASQGSGLPTHHPWIELLALLPLILILEWSLLGPEAVASRILAHAHLDQILGFFGLSPVVTLHATGLIVVLVLLIWHLLTGDAWKVQPMAIGRRWIEGLIAAAPLLAAAAFRGSIEQSPLATPLQTPSTLSDALAISIGAGLSEELLFRMIGIALMHWVLVDLCGLRQHIGTLLAVIGSAIAFTLYHDPSVLSPAGTFFVAAAGLYLGTLYVLRGFAVVVIAHTIYDAVIFAGPLIN